MIHSSDSPHKWSDYLKLILIGFGMGIANIIPGISGGTIAFIFGIYEDLIQSIKSFDGNFFRTLYQLRFKEAFSSASCKFLGSLLIGILCAIFLFSRIISWLLHNKPVFINAFFFGLILATAPIIARIIKKWTFFNITAVILVSTGTYFFFGLVPVAMPQTLWFVFLSGALAFITMILPGISGAFILVLLGQYHLMLEAVNQLDFLTLGVFSIGGVVGILAFVRVLSWLFHRYHDLTIISLTALVIGSLRRIWPWKEDIEVIATSHGKMISVEQMNFLPAQFNGDVFFALLLIAAGFIFAFLLNLSSQNSSLNSRKF